MVRGGGARGQLIRRLLLIYPENVCLAPNAGNVFTLFQGVLTFNRGEVL